MNKSRFDGWGLWWPAFFLETVKSCVNSRHDSQAAQEAEAKKKVEPKVGTTRLIRRADGRLWELRWSWHLGLREWWKKCRLKKTSSWMAWYCAMCFSHFYFNRGYFYVFLNYSITDSKYHSWIIFSSVSFQFSICLLFLSPRWLWGIIFRDESDRASIIPGADFGESFSKGTWPLAPSYKRIQAKAEAEDMGYWHRWDQMGG